MLVELYIFSVVIVAYGTFTTLALIGIGKLRRQIPFDHHTPAPFISIILSARNEEPHIVTCLEQFTKQIYSTDHFELILIDDASEDQTYEKAKTFLQDTVIDYQLIRQTEHKGKKFNLAEGISIAKGYLPP